MNFGASLTTRQALTFIRDAAGDLPETEPATQPAEVYVWSSPGPRPSSQGTPEDGDPASAGSVLQDVWVTTLAMSHHIHPDAVRAVVTTMPLNTEADLDLAERVLSCRPTVQEATEWATSPPTAPQAALIAALRT